MLIERQVILLRQKMGNKNLAGRALHLIYRYWQTHDHTYPTSRDIAIALGISVNQWGGVRKQLIQRGLMKNSPVWKIQFTELGLQYLQDNDSANLDMIEQYSDRPIEREIQEIEQRKQYTRNSTAKNFESNLEIPILGMVMAGPGDNLKAFDGTETVSIPTLYDLPEVESLTVWQVEGTSMLHEGINPGDYIITKKVNFLEVNEGDLIVAYYLSDEYNKNKYKQEDIELAIQDPSNFNGPTLKSFRKMEKDRRPIYELSWRDERDSKDVTKLFSRYLDVDQLWKVFAVYSPEKFRFFRK